GRAGRSRYRARRRFTQPGVQALDLGLVFLPQKLRLLAEAIDLGAERVGLGAAIPRFETQQLGPEALDLVVAILDVLTVPFLELVVELLDLLELQDLREIAQGVGHGISVLRRGGVVRGVEELSQ